MTLISLLIILFLEHQFNLSRILAEKLRARQLLPGWHKTVIGKTKDNAPLLIYTLLLMPVVIVVWLTSMEGDWTLGLFQFVLTLVVLSYSLGPINQNTHLAAYYEAVEREDLQAAFMEVQENLNQKARHEPPEDFESLGRQVTELILRQCNFRLFGVLFYYVIFGVGGALAYNLICNIEYHSRDKDDDPVYKIAQTVRTWVDWLPQRLTAILYGLAGDFNGAMAQFLPYAFKSGEQSCGMLEHTGLGAMGLEVEQRTMDVITENNQAMALVSRSGMVFILIIAIMTVFGWLN